MTNRLLFASFRALFLFTPLIWASWSFELFEYNKMMFVYLLTLIVLTLWLLKMLSEKSLIIKRTPLDIPLLLFLVANILSTIFSIDQHVSLWGYYSRSNGGLLSLISYLILYYAFVSNFEAKDAIRFLKTAVVSGLVVSLYAIPEHFGISPSCIYLTGEYTASCWVQDVQARVFATLGQPNWLAAFLGMLIFPALYFVFTASSKLNIIRFSLYALSMYLAFTFTYSRGATLGLMAGALTLAALYIWPTISSLRLHPRGVKLNLPKSLLIIPILFIGVNLLFGSALLDFKLLNKFAAPSRPSLATTSPGTQLESGGTESGKIRLIVWKGALEIFKHYPIFGSGVETFAFSYYNFRPLEHNLVSEWDFLYNKAHNEFLNYLATTGTVGFLSYLAVIITFIVCSMKYIVYRKEQTSQDTKYHILYASLLASYIFYLVQNFFGFSVVSIALFFFLFPAIAFTITGSTKSLSLNFHPSAALTNLVFSKVTKTLVLLTFSWLGWTLLQYYQADQLFAQGMKHNEDGNVGRAYNYFSDAVSLNRGEPFYQSELSYSAAAAASALSDKDATTSNRLKKQAISETEKTLSENPNNVSFYRTAIRTYYLLSTIDQDYLPKTLQILDQTIALAPTDVKLLYNKALILEKLDKKEEAIKLLEEAVKLKPNYREAYFSLAELYIFTGDKEKAKKQMVFVLKYYPHDRDAQEKLKEWEK